MKNPFDHDLEVIPLPAEPRRLFGFIPWPALQRWKVVADLHYVTRDGRTVTIPAGRLTDFASIPRFMWWLLPPDGDYLYAAVIHDELCDLHHAGTSTITRAQADRVLLEAMCDSDVIVWERWLVYAGVRLGGWFYWNKGVAHG